MASGPRHALSRPAAWSIVAIVTAAAILRFARIGDALHGLDEQYYWLVGSRIWAGDLPYVDLWDRKPFGLFLLFAGFRLLPGDGLVAGQVMAGVFGAATAFLVALIARRSVGWMPATMAGIFYLAGCNQLWAATTQTPIFYHLPVAAAALLCLRDGGRLRNGAVAAMLLLGIAVQIKTIAVIEGSFLFLYLATRRRRRSDALPVARFLMLALAAAGPTLAVVAFYASIGAFPAWWQANVASVLAKGAPRDADAFARLAEAAILAAPVLLLAVAGLWWASSRFTRMPRDAGFLAGWAVAGVLNFVAIGGFWPHYALPLLLALCPLVAHAFAIRRAGAVLFVLSMAWPVTEAVWPARIGAAGHAADVRRFMAVMPPAVREHCLYVHEGAVAWYALSGACIPTRFAFSGHLRSAVEGPALGVDPRAEVARILRTRPAAIVNVANSSWPDHDPAIEAMIARVLARDYRLAATVPGHDRAKGEVQQLWVRRRPSDG